MEQPNSDRFYKGISIFLFSFVFIYLLLRILFNETLHDEVASYMFYFYQGDYIGENIQWDANNHLLNSFIGHKLYAIFGDNFAVLRIPNLLAFVLYFFGTMRLTKELKTPYLKLTSLVALNSIPFIMEYFGNARGYGISLGFFIWGLVHLLGYFKTFKARPLFFTYLFMGLAVSANLTFVNSCLIILGLTVIAPMLADEKRVLKLRIVEWLFHFLFVLGLIPFILFGFALKETGALYYGSLEGLWDVTGKSLTKYVLFVDHDWIRFLYLIIFGLFLVYTFSLLKKLKASVWFKEPYLIYATLFFGNLAAVLVLAGLMEVNYPEDRTAMYLVILFLLLVFHLFESFKIGKWLQLGLLFFPATLLLNLSLHTSVFSPDDRLNNEFYAKVKKQIKPENSVMIYHIINWNWPYHESHSAVKASVGQFDNSNTVLSDILITKTTTLKNSNIPKLYDTIAYHPPSTYIAFKRKQSMQKLLLDSISTVDYRGADEFIDFAAFDLTHYRGKNLQLSIRGHLKTTSLKNKIKLIVQSSNDDGSAGRYLYYSFETTYQSQLINDDFLHHFVLEEIGLKEKQIKVYLWNRGFHPVEVSGVGSVLFELKSPENESR